MIFYFSATGNSKYVASKLKEEFSGEMIDISYAVKREEYDYMTEDDERVFIVFPVYFYGMPGYVEDFVRKLNFTGGTPQICGIATCGAGSGASDRMLKKAFREKGIKVRGFYQVKMIGNNVLLYKIPFREAQIMKMRRADKAIIDIIYSIKFLYRESYKSGFISGIFGKIANTYYRSHCGTSKYRVDERCIGCGLCQTICPVSAIDMDDNGRPQWIKKQCTHCLGCINRCPAEAIQYGKNTEKRGRYVNTF